MMSILPAADTVTLTSTMMMISNWARQAAGLAIILVVIGFLPGFTFYLSHTCEVLFCNISEMQSTVAVCIAAALIFMLTFLMLASASAGLTPPHNELILDFRALRRGSCSLHRFDHVQMCVQCQEFLCRHEFILFCTGIFKRGSRRRQWRVCGARPRDPCCSVMM